MSWIGNGDRTELHVKIVVQRTRMAQTEISSISYWYWHTIMQTHSGVLTVTRRLTAHHADSFRCAHCDSKVTPRTMQTHWWSVVTVSVSADATSTSSTLLQHVLPGGHISLWPLLAKPKLLSMAQIKKTSEHSSNTSTTRSIGTQYVFSVCTHWPRSRTPSDSTYSQCLQCLTDEYYWDIPYIIHISQGQ